MAFGRPRDTTVPKVGKVREPFVYPNQLIITTPSYIFVVVVVVVVTNASLALPTLHRSVAWSNKRHTTPSCKNSVLTGVRTLLGGIGFQHTATVPQGMFNL